MVIFRAQAFEVSQAAIQTSRDKVQSSESRLLSGFVPADGASIDKTTGGSASILDFRMRTRNTRVTEPTSPRRRETAALRT